MHIATQLECFLALRQSKVVPSVAQLGSLRVLMLVLFHDSQDLSGFDPCTIKLANHRDVLWVERVLCGFRVQLDTLFILAILHDNSLAQGHR